MNQIFLKMMRLSHRQGRIAVCLLLLVVWGLLIVSCRDSSAPTALTIYHVAPSGNDINPGNQDKPWKTVQKAAETMVAGDTVLIHAGIYYEKVTPVNSGTDGNYITYRNFGDGEVIIDAQEGVRTGCIEVTGKTYLRFVGLHLRNAGYTDLNAAFAAFPGSHHIILDRMIAETSRFGIMLRGGKTESEDPANTVSFVTIQNSTIRNNAAYGLFLYFKVTDSVIGPNNRVYNENDTNDVPDDDQYGINLDTNYPGNPANGARRIKIIENEIYGNRIQGVRSWNAQSILIQGNHTHHNGASGIQIEDGSANIIIDGNNSEYNAQSLEYESGVWIDSTVNAVVQNNIMRGNQIGLMVTQSDGVLLRNNVIFENNRAPSGSNVMGVVLNSNSEDITFVHNTVWQNGMLESRGNFALCIKPPVVNAVIKNNIFSGSRGFYDGWINCAVSSDFNDVYSSDGLLINWQGEDLSWLAYIKASGQDSHSLAADPLFVDPMVGDFSLSPHSPNVDSGSPLTQTTSAGSGKTIPVEDARYFTDGFGLVDGDTIRIGEAIAVVSAVDYTANTIIVDHPIQWEKGDDVSYTYMGTKPDQGAKEMGVTDK